MKNKLFTLLAPALALLFPLSAAPLPAAAVPMTETVVAATDGFSEDDVVLSFGVMSDVHIGFGNNSALLDNALRYYRNNCGVDGFLITGDLTQFGKMTEAHELMRIYKRHYDPAVTPFMACYGNHDTFMYDNLDAAGFYRAFLQESEHFYDKDVGPKEQIEAGNRWIQLQGSDGKTYDFLCVEFSRYGSSTSTSEETRTWLEQTLEAIEAERPDQYIFVTAHAPIVNTVTRSWSLPTNISGSSQMDEILKDHPNVIYFSGHTHSAVHKELSIHQSTYTQVHCGSETDLDLGGASNSTPDRHSYSSGELVELDSSGAVRISRIDFLKGKQIRSPWLLQPYGSEGFLDTYNFARRAEANTAPVWKQGASILAELCADGRTAITFDRAVDDVMVYSYEVSVKDSTGRDVPFTLADETGRFLYEEKAGDYFKGMIDDFYDWPDPESMPAQKTLYLSFAEAAPYPYTLSVVALDEYGGFETYQVDSGRSEPLTLQVENPATADAAAAENFASQVGSLGVPTLEKLLSVRKIYASMSYGAKTRAQNAYEIFAAKEKEFYATYSPAPVGKAPSKTQFETFLSAPVKGSVEGTDRGVRLSWSSAPTNNLIGFAGKKKIDGLKLTFSGLENKSEDPTFGIVLTNRRGGKWTSGKSALLRFDLDSGVVRYGDRFYLGKSEFFTLDQLGSSPFTLAFSRSNGALEIELTTVLGTERFLLPAEYLGSLTELTDPASAYVYFTPLSSRQTMQVDLISVH